MKKIVSHNVKQNSRYQSTISSLTTTTKCKSVQLCQTMIGVKVKVSLAKAGSWIYDSPMTRQTVCESQSVGTISSIKGTRFLVRLISWINSTRWVGRFSEKTLLFTEFFVRCNFQSERVPGKDRNLCMELKLRSGFWIHTITDSMNNWCELMRLNNITNLLNPFQALTSEPLCCYLEFFTNQSIS